MWNGVNGIFERVEVEQEENARCPLVNRQQEAPVLDAVAGVGRPARIAEPELHAVGAHRVRSTNSFEIGPSPTTTS